jgi:hypothetical protein
MLTILSLTDFNYVKPVRAETIPSYKLLFTDDNDSLALDINQVSMIYDSENIIFKITFYKKWNNQNSNYNIFMLIDSDNNVNTGSNGSNDMRHGNELLVFLGYLNGTFSSVLNNINAKAQTTYLDEIPYYYLPVNEKIVYIAFSKKHIKSDKFKFWIGCNNHNNKEYDSYPDETSKVESVSVDLSSFTMYSGRYLTKITLQINNKNAIINDKNVTMDVAPFIKKDKTFVAFRFIGENIGATVNYKMNDSTKKLEWVSYLLNVKSIFLFLGKKDGFVNGRTINVDPPPELFKDRAVVPLRFVSENLNCLVKWFPKNKTILITSLKYAEEPLSSVDTVKNFLDSQVREDIDESLTYVDLGRLGPTGDTSAKELVTEIGKRLNIKNFKFEKQSNVDFDKDNLSIVRFSSNSEIEAKDGFITQHTGSVVFLQKRNNIWKIITFIPDEFLNLQYTIEDINKNDMYLNMLNGQTVANYKSINTKLNNALHKIYIDKFKASLDSTASLIGFVPGIGDLISNTYTFFDMVYQIPDMYSDIKLGNYNCAMFGMIQIGWGVVQMCAEYIPGLDHGTDALGILLDQSVKNVRFQWAFLILKNSIINTRISGKKYLYPYYKAGLKIPDDIRFFNVNNWPAQNFTPPETLYIMSDRAYTNNIPLYFGLIACAKIDLAGSKELAEACKVLKATINSDVDIAYIPILFKTIAKSNVSEGADILTDMFIERRIGFKVTCRRGIQFLKVKTEDGTYTEPLIIENLIYNSINNAFAYDSKMKQLDSINLNVNEKIDGIKILGSIPKAIMDDLKIQSPPDLTTLNCVNYSIENPNIAEFTLSGKTMTFKGKTNGSTVLNIRFPGSPAIYHRKEVLDLNVSIPISVGSTFEIQPKEATVKLNEENKWKVKLPNPSGNYYTRWNFGDNTGNFESTKNTIRVTDEVVMSHIYQKPGVYEIKVYLIETKTNKTITYSRGKVTVQDSGAPFPKYVSIGIYLYNEYSIVGTGKTIKSDLRIGFDTKDSNFPGTLSWSGNTFTMKISDKNDEASYTFVLTGTLSSDFKKLDLAIHATSLAIAEHTGKQLNETIDIEFKGLPIDTFNYSDKSFKQQMKGEKIKDYLKTFKHDYQFEDLNTDTGKYYIGSGRYLRTIWNEDSSVGCYGSN